MLPDSSKREEWMEAPMSPLSNDQIRALSRAWVADPEWDGPNEVYLTARDSHDLMGDVAREALDALATLCAASSRKDGQT